MKLENQVCTLEQAKKLKELGIEQSSAFYFYEQFLNSKRTMEIYPLEHHDGYARTTEDDSLLSALNGQSKNEIYSAYTVAELGVMLPCFNKQNGNGFWLSFPAFSDNINEWIGAIETPNEDHSNTIRTIIKEGTEAEARAAMIIYLLENKHTTPEEVNERLKNA